jgi:hypothetical protein
MEAINESLHPPLDNRVRDACQYISDHLADSHRSRSCSSRLIASSSE